MLITLFTHIYTIKVDIFHIFEGACFKIIQGNNLFRGATTPYLQVVPLLINRKLEESINLHLPQIISIIVRNNIVFTRM